MIDFVGLVPFFRRITLQVAMETMRFEGGSTFALIFQKSWFICATFHSIHLRAYFSQVKVTIALTVFY